MFETSLATTLSQSGRLLDRKGRIAKKLRISVTDRCNLRCNYCMPMPKYEWIDRREILSYEEITRLAR